MSTYGYPSVVDDFFLKVKLAVYADSFRGGEEFEIEDSVIGRGGMALIRAGHRKRDGQAVALKMLKDAYAADPYHLKWFRKEAEILSRLSSPHISKYEGIGAREGKPFIAMELVPGKTLESILSGGKRLTETGVLHVVKTVGLALSETFGKGIVHCDLKPENIIMDAQGQVKVIDFGVARDGRNQDEPECIAGTCEYMSPEQGLNRKLDVRSDIYSLGMVLYHLVVGTPAFKDVGSFTEVIYHHVHVQPPPLTMLSSRIRGLVERCISKNPQDRPQDPEALLKIVEDARAELPASQELWT